MSNTPATMSPQEANDVLMRRVHSRVFFNKLASYGIVPKDGAEAEAMLKTAAKLHVLHDAQQAKQSQAASSVLTKLSSAVDDRLAAMGLAAPAAATTTVPADILKTAQAAAQDPELATAVLTLLQHNTAA